MTLKKTVWTAALCAGFVGALFASSPLTLAAAVEAQETIPMDKGPHVLPPF